jgi:transcriptional regulator with XRE-family HTH domain
LRESLVKDWLKEIRLREGLKQKNLARELGITPAFYCFIEKGIRNVSVNLAKSIAAALHFERYGIDWTRFYEDERETAPQETGANA